MFVIKACAAVWIFTHVFLIILRLNRRTILADSQVIGWLYGWSHTDKCINANLFIIQEPLFHCDANEEPQCSYFLHCYSVIQFFSVKVGGLSVKRRLQEVLG